MYVGVTRAINKRFYNHKYKKTFKDLDEIEIAILFNGITKERAEFLGITCTNFKIQIFLRELNYFGKQYKRKFKK